jgi:aspartate kinase
MIVLKFGGSSVEDPEALLRVVEIVRSRLASRPVVVISAMAKTTRRLLDSAEAAAAGNLPAALEIAQGIRQLHRSQAEAVIAGEALPATEKALDEELGRFEALLERIAGRGELSPHEADAAASAGEVLSSLLLAAALPSAGIAAAWVDCRKVVVTDDAFTRAQPLYEETEPRLRRAIGEIAERGAVAVLGGYVGATRDGVVTTLGLEGSDFSAAIVGAALGAREIQIWTDVDGILTADPRLVPRARLVRSLSFAESLELAFSGAKKPHPGTLGPASRAGVPIRILNSRRPDPAAEGTLIGRRSAAPPTAKSIACRMNDHLLYALPPGEGAGVGGDGADADGFVRDVLLAAAAWRPALLPLATDSGDLRFAIDHAGRLAEIETALTPVARFGVLHGRAVVSVVSEDLETSPELARTVLAAAAAYDPRLVTRGVRCPVVRFAVELEDLPRVISDLHDELFSESGGPVA